MSHPTQIALLSPFTLTNIGLKQLLCHFFAVGRIDIYTNITDFLAAHPEQYDLYFVTADTFLSCADFFLPRKSRSVILCDRTTDTDETKASFQQLYIHDEAENIIEKLEGILNSIVQKSADELREEL